MYNWEILDTRDSIALSSSDLEENISSFSAMAAANYHSSRLASSQWIAIYHSAISRLLNTQDTSV